MIGGFAFLAGVLLGLAAARLPGVLWMYCSGVATVAVLVTPLRHERAPRRLAMLLAGLLLAQLAARDWLERRLVPASADARVLLEGIICSVPVRDGADLQFDAEMHVTEGPGAARDGLMRRARLRWREPVTMPRVGERWRLIARLAPATDTQNFAARDVERMAYRDRVHLTARVLPSALNTRLAPADASVDGLRARIADRISARVVDPDAAGLIIALAVGLTDGISTDQWRVFNATGTTHLVAISGLHVTLFAVLATFAARGVWRRWPGCRYLERESFALGAGLAAAGGYSLLAGFSVPTQRTWLMLAVFVCARLSARRVGAARTWSLSLMAVLLLDVLAPLAAGFWLSFMAVAVILLVETTTIRPGARAHAALRLQCAVMLALAPLTFAIFGGVSLAGLLVNLLAIPVISFGFVPLVLTGALLAICGPGLDGRVFDVAAFAYQKLWPAMVWAADFDFALWRFEPAWWWYALAAPAALLLLRPWPVALRLTTAGLVLPLICAPTRLPDLGTMRVSVLDAGRGTAVIIATHEHVLLFDTGDSWGTRGTRAMQMALPAFDALTRRHLELLVLPSLNPDRAMGAALLANELRIDRMLVGGGWPGTSLPVVDCADTAFTWDGIELQTFAAGRHREFCVLRAANAGHAVLLAGDLDAAAERELLARLPAGALASDVVLMSRQASALGSSPQWIDSAGAGVAIATGGVAGSDSRALATRRWRDAGARVLDTHSVGGIEIVFGTQGITRLALARATRYPFAWRRID